MIIGDGERVERYVDEIGQSLELFKNRYWRCEAKNGFTSSRCRNTRGGHEKGHQYISRLSTRSFLTLRSEPAPVSKHSRTRDQMSQLMKEWVNMSC